MKKYVMAIMLILVLALPAWGFMLIHGHVSGTSESDVGKPQWSMGSVTTYTSDSTITVYWGEGSIYMRHKN